MDRIDAMQAFVAVADLQGFAPAAARLDMGIGGARSLGFLDRLHRRGERDIAGIAVSV